MQNCIYDGLVYCTGVVYIPHCFMKEKELWKIFKLGILMVLQDGLVQCTDVMYMHFCFVSYIGRDGKYFKVGFLIEALFRVATYLVCYIPLSRARVAS